MRNGLTPDGQAHVCQVAELSEQGEGKIIPGVLRWISTFLSKTAVLCPDFLAKRNVRIARILSLLSLEEYSFVDFIL